MKHAMYGRNHLRRAAALFHSPEGSIPSPSVLADAFAHVWAAVAFCHHWPPADRADLAGLIAASRRYGSCADTAWKMTAEEVNGFRDELFRILARAARLPNRRDLWSDIGSRAVRSALTDGVDATVSQ